MRHGIVGAIASLLVGSGVTLAQPAPTPMQAPSPDTVVVTPDGLPEGMAAPPMDGGLFDGDDVNMPEQVWFRGEYLRWKIKDGPMPVLRVTTGNPADFEPGALGQPGTRLLFDASSLHFDDQSGGRLSAGYWLDTQKLFFEFSGFLLEKSVNNFAVNSQGGRLPVIALPFIDEPSGEALAFQAAVAGDFAGGVNIVNTSQLGGFETNLIGVCETGNSRWMVVLGFRYLDLQEHLDISFQQQAIGLKFVAFGGDRFPAPNAVAASDSFSTRNQFYSGQLGGRWEHHLGRFWVNAGGDLAVGQNHEVVERFGISRLIGPAAGLPPIPGGLFAVRSNIGRIISDNFALVPDLHARLGFNFTDNWSAVVGYDVLYWNRVVRPGNQVDNHINTTQVPTDANFVAGARPAFPTRLFNQSDFWAQGISVGLECRY